MLSQELKEKLEQLATEPKEDFRQLTAETFEVEDLVVDAADGSNTYCSTSTCCSTSGWACI